MVDADRLARILQRAADDIALLRSYANEDVLADPAKLGHAKYLFVTAIEGLVDAAQHVCASEGWGPPDTNADAMELLARHGVLDAGLGRTAARMVGFRNILVHGYRNVEDNLVVANLGRLGELDAVIAALAELI